MGLLLFYARWEGGSGTQNKISLTFHDHLFQGLTDNEAFTRFGTAVISP